MHAFTWFGWLSDKITHDNIHVFNGLLVFVVLLVASLIYKSSLKSVDQEIMPTSGTGLKNILQAAVESLHSMVSGVIKQHPEDYTPFLGAIFIYIFVSNMIALIPGVLPPTENINTNMAIALSVFIYYNAMGIKRQGLKTYLAHFWGPVALLGPLIFTLEFFVANCLRPISLSLRLFGNINGDHLVLKAFTDLVPIGVPIIFLAFGIFVAFIQAFVFTLLSTIYVGLAVETHDEHGDDHGHQGVHH
jgi:F-type H+-transporting ATPase subunit a